MAAFVKGRYYSKKLGRYVIKNYYSLAKFKKSKRALWKKRKVKLERVYYIG